MFVPWNILMSLFSFGRKQGCLIFGHRRTVLHSFGKCCLVICMCVNYLGAEYTFRLHPTSIPQRHCFSLPV